MIQRKRWLLAGSAAALALAVGWWLGFAPEAPARGAGAPGGAWALSTPTSAEATAAQRAVSTGTNASLQTGDSFLTDRLQQTFEDMLLEVMQNGAAPDASALKQRLAVLVPKYFSAALSARAFALLERYVDYRQALGQLAAPTDPSDPSAMRAAVQARQRVRQQHFTPEEYEALFGPSERLDQFTLARLELERQTGLTDAQKRAALQTAEQGLSPAQRAQRADAVAHVGVQQQTAAFDSANTSEAERFAQRSAQYGVDAATRLSQLDTEDRQWQSGLDQYAKARANMGANTPTAEQTQALAQLRQQLFTPEQHARVEAGLQLRALNQR